MYATIDLKSGMFIRKYDDSEITQEQLERDIARTALANHDIIVGGLHMNEKDVITWRSKLVFGPRGESLAVSRGEKAMAVGDTTKLLEAANRKHRQKIKHLKDDFLVNITKLLEEQEEAVASIIRAAKAAGKPTPPVVTKAGYDQKGNWHNEGEQYQDKWSFNL